MTPTFASLLERTMTSRTPVVVDGGLGTVLESRGVDLGHELWSAELLRRSPETLAEVHADYARAGARIVTTASYQATPLGFSRAGVTESEGRALIEASVRIAAEAVAGIASATAVTGNKSRAEAAAGSPSSALVAGSVGPYGAALGDGSEYSGTYALSSREFADFHRPRIEALVAAGADLLAIETQPHLGEIEVLAELADEYGIPAWLSVTLRQPESPEPGARSGAVSAMDGSVTTGDGTVPGPSCSTPTLADGSDLRDLAAVASAHGSIRALGVNCVPPRLVGPALRALSQATDLPLIAYPNSGEVYDAEAMQWRTEETTESASEPASVSGSGGSTSARDSVGASANEPAPAEPAAGSFPLEEWIESGLRLVGGCCRTTPADIAALARRIGTRR